MFVNEGRLSAADSLSAVIDVKLWLSGQVYNQVNDFCPEWMAAMAGP